MDILFQLSLLGSFIAGMVALFAPCCITFLLPVSVMFNGIGLVVIALSLSGALAMSASEESATRLIQSVAVSITAGVQSLPLLDVAFVLVAFRLLYRFIRYVRAA